MSLCNHSILWPWAYLDCDARVVHKRPPYCIESHPAAIRGLHPTPCRRVSDAGTVLHNGSLLFLSRDRPVAAGRGRALLGGTCARPRRAFAQARSGGGRRGRPTDVPKVTLGEAAEARPQPHGETPLAHEQERTHTPKHPRTHTHTHTAPSSPRDSLRSSRTECHTQTHAHTQCCHTHCTHVAANISPC